MDYAAWKEHHLDDFVVVVVKLVMSDLSVSFSSRCLPDLAKLELRLIEIQTCQADPYSGGPNAVVLQGKACRDTPTILFFGDFLFFRNTQRVH